MELYDAGREIVERMNTLLRHWYCLRLKLKVQGVSDSRNKFSINTKSVNPYNNSFEMLTRDLKRLKTE